MTSILERAKSVLKKGNSNGTSEHTNANKNMNTKMNTNVGDLLSDTSSGYSKAMGQLHGLSLLHLQQKLKDAGGSNSGQIKAASAKVSSSGYAGKGSTNSGALSTKNTSGYLKSETPKLEEVKTTSFPKTRGFPQQSIPTAAKARSNHETEKEYEVGSKGTVKPFASVATSLQNTSSQGYLKAASNKLSGYLSADKGTVSSSSSSYMKTAATAKPNSVTTPIQNTSSHSYLKTGHEVNISSPSKEGNGTVSGISNYMKTAATAKPSSDSTQMQNTSSQSYLKTRSGEKEGNNSSSNIKPAKESDSVVSAYRKTTASVNPTTSVTTSIQNTSSYIKPVASSTTDPLVVKTSPIAAIIPSPSKVEQTKTLEKAFVDLEIEESDSSIGSNFSDFLGYRESVHSTTHDEKSRMKEEQRNSVYSSDHKEQDVTGRRSTDRRTSEILLKPGLVNIKSMTELLDEDGDPTSEYYSMSEEFESYSGNSIEECVESIHDEVNYEDASFEEESVDSITEKPVVKKDAVVLQENKVETVVRIPEKHVMKNDSIAELSKSVTVNRSMEEPVVKKDPVVPTTNKMESERKQTLNEKDSQKPLAAKTTPSAIPEPKETESPKEAKTKTTEHVPSEPKAPPKTSVTKSEPTPPPISAWSDQQYPFPYVVFPVQPPQMSLCPNCHSTKTPNPTPPAPQPSTPPPMPTILEPDMSIVDHFIKKHLDRVTRFIKTHQSKLDSLSLGAYHYTTLEETQEYIKRHRSL